MRMWLNGSSADAPLPCFRRLTPIVFNTLTWFAGFIFPKYEMLKGFDDYDKQLESLYSNLYIAYVSHGRLSDAENLAMDLRHVHWKMPATHRLLLLLPDSSAGYNTSIVVKTIQSTHLVSHLFYNRWTWDWSLPDIVIWLDLCNLFFDMELRIIFATIIIQGRRLY